MKKILIVTNLPVWSIAKGVGAPSFYKTLEFYNDKGFSVDLWTTEKKTSVDELENVKVKKLPVIFPLIKVSKLYYLSRNISYLLNQLMLIIVFFLSKKKNCCYDLLYVYEVEFVPALKFISYMTNKPLVTRFQGTILYPLMGKKFWKIRYFPHVISLSIKSDLTIMTDDGTRGDKVLKLLRKKNSGNILFLKNGVDDYKINQNNISDLVKQIVRRSAEKVIFFFCFKTSKLEAGR